MLDVAALINPSNLSRDKRPISEEVSDVGMRDESQPNVCCASCVCVCVCVCTCMRACACVAFGWRDVTAGLQHFAKDKWGFL